MYGHAVVLTPGIPAFRQTQAQELADHFLSLPEGERPTAIFSSPYCTSSPMPSASLIASLINLYRQTAAYKLHNRQLKPSACPSTSSMVRPFPFHPTFHLTSQTRHSRMVLPGRPRERPPPTPRPPHRPRPILHRNRHTTLAFTPLLPLPQGRVRRRSARPRRRLPLPVP